MLIKMSKMRMTIIQALNGLFYVYKYRQFRGLL
jgi:hypothetical protein